MKDYEDAYVLNYIKSVNEEYGDNILEDDIRQELYWSMASIRRHSFSFYPLPENEEVLIIGDKFGAITGIVCEKAAKVDSVVSNQEYAEAIAHRYNKRHNLNIIVGEYDNWSLNKTYTYVVANLEYIKDYNINDSYEFMRVVQPAINCIKADGKLLILANGNELNNIKRFLYKFGFYYWQKCEPLGNGDLFIEASKIDALSEWKLMRPSPVTADKWMRIHWLIGRGGDIEDQDKDLIEDVVKVQVDLLKKLIEVCNEEKLAIYPMYGTLLGIIRDGGIIKGDDDIDVAMPRADYDRLMQMSERFSGVYFLQTPQSDDCFYGGYTKLRNKVTTAIHPQNEWTEACEGISIDIFPLDVSYADENKERRKCKKIRFWQRLLYAKSYGYFKEFKDMPLLKWKFYKYFGLRMDRKKMINKLNHEMRKGDEMSNMWAIYCHYANGTVINARYVLRKSFNHTIPLLFEGVYMQVPSDWEALLRGLYGDGYANRMGFMEGKRRHGFYDANIPYTVYKRRFGGLKHPENIKEPVVIFGDGSVFNACLSYYKTRVNIVHLVQLPGEKAIGSVQGMKVESWEEFHSLDIARDSYRAVICSGDARAAEKMLRKAGYEDYFIFWYNRDWMLYANQTQIWREIQQLR